MSLKTNQWIFVVVFLVVLPNVFAHPPTEMPEPHSWVPRNLIVKDAVYSATAVIDDATLSGAMVTELVGGGVTNLHSHPNALSATEVVSVSDMFYLTDDRGPGWWTVGSDVFSASLTYKARSLEKIQVNGYAWPLVADGYHIEYQYRDDDSTMLAGFTLRRSTGMTGLSVKANRVEWFYLSNEFEPNAEVANGLWPIRGEPAGAVLNGVMSYGSVGDVE